MKSYIENELKRNKIPEKNIRQPRNQTEDLYTGKQPLYQ